MIVAQVVRALAAVGVERRGESRVLVACSGGVDSVVLAHAAVVALGARRVVLGHVDHAVRAGSPADAAWVAAYAAGLGAASVSVRLAPGPDDEARLREARYAALEAQRAGCGAAWILTAHSADDQAETVLLGLIRSPHAEVLAGMPQRRGAILRPLLEVPRAVIRAYAARERLDWREDPTNPDPRWLRNRLRKELLPLIEARYRAGFAERLARLATQLQARALGAALDGPAGASAPALAAGDTRPSRARHDRGSNRPTASPVVSPMEIAIERRPWSGSRLPERPDVALFDADVLERLVVRPIRPGDRIRPMGLGGSKKLQDVLVDAKVPREVRSGLWVAAHPGSGEVVWVPGLARAEVAPVSTSTTQVWILTCGPSADPSL